MTRPNHYSFIRYLEAKRTVDDRALNQQVWRCFLHELDGLPRKQPLKALEVGAGTGAMLHRMLEWDLDHDMEYTAMDLDPSLLKRAAERLLLWAKDRGWQAKRPHQDRLILSSHRHRITVDFLSKDIFDMPEDPEGVWDLIIAHAFLDLVDLERGLPLLFSLLRPHGLFYFTLVFDGATIFRPPLDPDFDALVEVCYHRTMDERIGCGRRGGGSQTGRILLEVLSAQNAAVFAAGSSDWVVYPPYKGDEAYFLHHILHVMEEALSRCSDIERKKLDQWISARHRQVEEGQLIYVAHQLDVLGRP